MGFAERVKLWQRTQPVFNNRKVHTDISRPTLGHTQPPV